MKITNFAILQGQSITTSDGKLTYDPTIRKNKNEHLLGKTQTENDDVIDNVVVRSNAIFGSGSLEFSLKISSLNTAVILVFKSFDNKRIRCGYSRIWNKFVIIEDSLNAKPFSMAGSLSNYDLGQELRFKIDVQGSLLTILINEIILCEANISIKESPLEINLASDSRFEVYDIKLNKSKPKIFIVMQFSKEYNELYEEVIKPVSEKFDYECIRADEFYTGTPIISDIITSIQEATVIIAEITPDNPNVFYEIGYAHAVKKPTILLCDKVREKLPFDLSGFRTLFYENTIAGKRKVELSLTKYLENI